QALRAQDDEQDARGDQAAQRDDHRRAEPVEGVLDQEIGAAPDQGQRAEKRGVASGHAASVKPKGCKRKCVSVLRAIRNTYASVFEEDADDFGEYVELSDGLEDDESDFFSACLASF